MKLKIVLVGAVIAIRLGHTFCSGRAAADASYSAQTASQRHGRSHGCHFRYSRAHGRNSRVQAQTRRSLPSRIDSGNECSC